MSKPADTGPIVRDRRLLRALGGAVLAAVSACSPSAPQGPETVDPKSDVREEPSPGGPATPSPSPTKSPSLEARPTPESEVDARPFEGTPRETRFEIPMESSDESVSASGWVVVAPVDDLDPTGAGDRRCTVRFLVALGVPGDDRARLAVPSLSLAETSLFDKEAVGNDGLAPSPGAAWGHGRVETWSRAVVFPGFRDFEVEAEVSANVGGKDVTARFRPGYRLLPVPPDTVGVQFGLDRTTATEGARWCTVDPYAVPSEAPALHSVVDTGAGAGWGL